MRLANSLKTLDPQENYETQLFKEVNDLNKFKLYDKYSKLLEALIGHPIIEEIAKQSSQLPLFLRIPDVTFEHADRMALENDGEGYMNFQMVQHRLRNKKYGPGKNQLKEGLL